MDTVLKLLDNVWNIRFLTGYRSAVAKFLMVGLSAYQFLATSSELAKTGIPGLLPDVPTTIYTGLMTYFGLKYGQFINEHKPA